MKDILQDVVAKTHSLGFLSLVKVTGDDTSTTVESMAEDRSVILSANTKEKVAEFVKKQFDSSFGTYCPTSKLTILIFFT